MSFSPLLFIIAETVIVFAVVGFRKFVREVVFIFNNAVFVFNEHIVRFALARDGRADIVLSNVYGACIVVIFAELRKLDFVAVFI